MKTEVIVAGLFAAYKAKFCPEEENDNKCVAGE